MAARTATATPLHVTEYVHRRRPIAFSVMAFTFYSYDSRPVGKVALYTQQTYVAIGRVRVTKRLHVIVQNPGTRAE